MKRLLSIALCILGISCINAQVFQTPVELINNTGGDSFTKVYLGGDLNNDGLIDFVGEDADGNSYKYYFNNGDGSFEEQVFDAGNPSNPIAIGDFNQDGLPDVLSSTRMIATNLGNNMFGYEFDVSSNSSFDQVRVGVADFDNDGVLDYLANPYVSSEFADHLYWHKGDGDYTFTAVPAETTLEHKYTSIVDFNQDGAPDIISANQFGDGQFKIMRNDGSGNFELYRDLRDISVSESFLFADMADMDNDGDYEIVGVSWSGGVYYVENEGEDEFSFFPTYVDPFYFGEKSLAVVVGDVNNDGYPDVINYDDDGSNYLVYASINNKNGGFDTEKLMLEMERYSGVVPTGSTVRNLVQLIDVDGNESPDIVINDTKNGRILVAYNSTIISSVDDVANTLIDVYPNPSSDFIAVNHEFDYSSYQILANNGAIVKKGNKELQIDISELAVGNYVLVLLNRDAKVGSASFVKN